MKNIAIIFAGGIGQRMDMTIPKQFLKISGKEIIVHTLEIFESNINVDEIYVVCVKSWIPVLEKLIEKYELYKVQGIIPGGISGQDSIFNGLEFVSKKYQDAVVLLHDGVRPLVDQNTINLCIDSVKKLGSAVTVSRCYETPVRSIDGMLVDEIPLRSEMYMAQAPQCFYLKDIYNVHIEERKQNDPYKNIVDSCSLMFKYGAKCHLVEGNRSNIKITTQEDLYIVLSKFSNQDYLDLAKNEEQLVSN